MSHEAPHNRHAGGVPSQGRRRASRRRRPIAVVLAALLAVVALPFGEPAAAAPLPVGQADVVVDGRALPGPPIPHDHEHRHDAEPGTPPHAGDDHGDDHGHDHGHDHGDDHGHALDPDAVLPPQPEPPGDAAAAGGARDPLAVGASAAPLAPAPALTPAPEPVYLPEERWTSVTEAPFTFGMVGFTLARGAALPSAARFRLSTDGERWGGWRDVHFDSADAPDGSSTEGRNERPGTQPVFIGAARWVELETNGSQEGLRAVFLDIDGRTASVLDRVKSFLSSVTAPLRSVGKGRPAGAAGRPAIVTRAQWGANEALRTGSPSYGQVKVSIVHHTDGSNNYTQAQVPGILRGIYNFHVTSRGWSDIGYNFLVDKFGRIYEGRFGGMERAVIGSQAAGFNSVSTGVSIIGSHTAVAPSAASLDAVARVLGWKLALHRVNPLGRTNVSGSGGGTSRYAAGQVVNLRNVSGHRDTSFTTCPGDLTYAQLNSVAAATNQYYKDFAKDWNVTDRASGLASGAGRAAVIETFGGRHVFARSLTGDGVVHTWNDPVTARWATTTLDIGGSSGDDLVALTAYGQLHVFGRPAGGATGIRHLWYDTRVGWSAETLDVGGSRVEGVAATMYNGQLHVFTTAAVPGPAGNVRHVWFDPLLGWLTESLDAGTNARLPSVVVQYGQLHLFSEATGGGLRHGWFTLNVGWNHASLDVAGGSGAWSTAVATGDEIHAFARTTSGTGLRHVYHIPGQGWLAETLDASDTTGAGAATAAGGTLRWVGEGAGDSANALRHLYWTGAQWLAESVDSGRSTGRNAVAGVSLGEAYVTSEAVGGGVRDALFGKTRTDFFTEDLSAGVVCTPGVVCPLSGSERAATVLWDGEAHIFGAPQSGGGIAHTWYSPIQARWFSEVLDAGGSTGADAVAFTALGQLHVVTRPAGGASGVRHAWFSPGVGWNFATLDVGNSSVDGLAYDASYGQIHLYTRAAVGGAATNGLRHLWYGATGWNAETLDGAGGTGADVAVVGAYGRVHTFGPAAGGGIRHVFYSPGLGWAAETLDIGATTGAATTATLAPDQSLHLFAAANGGGVRRHVYRPGAGWTVQTLDVAATTGAGTASALDVVHWAGQGAGADAPGLRVISQFGAGLTATTIDRAVAGANVSAAPIEGALYITYGTPGGRMRLAVYRPAA